MSRTKQKKNAYQKIAAIETTSPVMSLALYEHETMVAEYRLHRQMTHSEKLISTLSWMIKENGWEQGPDVLAVDVGPGSFTGIRVGVSMVRALAQAWDIPVVGVKSLDVLAEGAGNWPGLLCSVIDALRNEVFEARYARMKTIKKITDYRLVGMSVLLESLRRHSKQILFIGSGAHVHARNIQAVLGDKAYVAPDYLSFPFASGVARLAIRMLGRASVSSYENIQPFYIRRPAAEERLKAEREKL